MKNYNCIAVLENSGVRQYQLDAKDAKHAKNKLYMIMSYEGITNVYKINIEENTTMYPTEFERVEKELVEELEKRGLEIRDEELELAVEYIITTRSVNPTYSANQYITDTLSYYPEMLIEK